MVLNGMITFTNSDSMKRFSTIPVIITLLFITGCSKNELDIVSPVQCCDDLSSSDISAILNEDASMTKMVFQEGLDSNSHLFLQSKWSESDAIVISSNQDDASKAVVFNLIGGQGTGTGIFRGDKELTEKSLSWTIYYPVSVKTDSDFSSFSFDGQTQKGNNNTSHLSSLNLMRKRYHYSTPETAPTAISFSGDDFEQSSCIKFILSDFPESITPKSLTMEVYNYATWIWSSLGQEVVVETDFSQTLSFTDIQATSSLTAYMMIPPAEHIFSKGQFMRITLDGYDGKKIVTERKLSNDLCLQSGTYNILSLKKNWVLDTGVDGTWGVFQTPSADATNKYCNIIFMGDGYTYSDYEGTESKFLKDARDAYEAVFSIEPYKSLKDYFGVYYVNVVSGQKINTEGSYLNGAKNVDTHTTLEVQFTPNETKTSGNEQRAMYYAELIPDLTAGQVCRSTMCVIANTYCHAGSCTLYYGNWETDYCENYSIAYLALGHNDNDQAESYRRCVIHEVGGHGIGKLADEYTMPQYYPNPTSAWNNLSSRHARGIYHNVNKYEEGITTVNDTPWSGLENIKTYSPEQIGVYDGAYTVNRDFCRSTPNSIMRESSPYSNADYFNAVSRRQIYHRIMRLSGKSQQEADDEFLTWDAAHLPTSGPYIQTKSAMYVDSRNNNGLLPLAEPTAVCCER